MNLSVNFKSIKFNNIVIVSNRAAYDWYMQNFFPYYSQVWLYCVEPNVIDDELSSELKNQIENNESINVIIFGIQNYTKFNRIRTQKILVMDNIIMKSKLLNMINRSIVEIISGYCQQWFNIDRIPNKEIWTNSSLSKKGDIYTLLG
jgi:hypothetical protein